VDAGAGSIGHTAIQGKRFIRSLGLKPVRKGHPDRRVIMKWEQPTACDMRFGFEITMYIANR